MSVEATEEHPRWVQITSDDGFSFIVERKIALGSTLLADSLTGSFSESLNNTCSIPVRGAVVEKVTEYLSFKAQFKDAKGETPSFLDRIPPELALELLTTADYLGL